MYARESHEIHTTKNIAAELHDGILLYAGTEPQPQHHRQQQEQAGWLYTVHRLFVRCAYAVFMHCACVVCVASMLVVHCPCVEKALCVSCLPLGLL
jgi:hypothetical protein